MPTDDPTVTSDPGTGHPLVGAAVTARIVSGGPAGFRCAVRDTATLRTWEALLPRAHAYAVPEGAAAPDLAPGDTLTALVVGVSGAPGGSGTSGAPGVSGAPGRSAVPAKRGRRDGAGGEPGRLLLSATAPELAGRVLAGFVDEILRGRVVIKAVARVAGTKTKIAVAATVRGVDARGACIGRGAGRLRAAERLLNRASGRERLEIIEYSGDPARFLANAMSPVRVTEVLIRDDGDAVVAVEEHQLSGGIGEGGLNAQLAGRLTGHYVQVVRAGTDLRTVRRAPRTRNRHRNPKRTPGRGRGRERRRDET